MKNMKQYITIIFAVLCSFAARAQTGTIKGTIKDAKSKESLIGATVVLEGTTVGAAADIEGNYIINKVPAKAYTAVVTYVGYKTEKVAITVENGKVTLLNSTLEDESTSLQEVVVVGTRRTNTTVAVITEIKEAQQVVSGISAEQILRSQDRDAGEVVRRIPGVTIVDNRFINIRGLNDRYNSVWLNDVTAPSSETDRKAFSFDIIPSNLLDRILIYKTAAPELPGDYAGGLVKIYTRKPSFSERQLSVNYTTGFRAGTTFKAFTQDKTSSLDWLGFGAGDRKIPTGVPSANGSQPIPTDVAKQFKNTYPLSSSSAIPDQRLNISYLTGFKLGSHSLGSLSALSYSNTFTTYNIDRTFRLGNGEASSLFNDLQYTNSVRLGALQNFSFSLGSLGKIEFRNMYNQISRNQVTVREEETTTGQLTRASYSEGYQSRGIYNGQLAAELNLGSTNLLDATFGIAFSNRKEPDLRRTAYNISSNDVNDREILIQGSGLNPTYASRLYQNLTENIATANINYKHLLSLFGNEGAELKAGTFIELKNRKFDSQLVGYEFPNSGERDNSLIKLPLDQVFSPDNIKTGGFRMAVQNSPLFIYDADNKLYAGYLAANLPFTTKLKLYAGARYEYNIQSINSAVTNSSPAQRFEVVTNKILPSANLSYNFSDKSLIRAAYGRSLNRPEFREWAPFAYYDFDINATIFGSLNANAAGQPLKVADIDNVDVRYELYPSEGENIHIGAFYKHFNNPIETYILNGTSEIQYSFRNSKSAYAYGVELDVRKNLSFIGTETFFKDLTVLLNASLIKSEVDVSGTFAWNTKRSLQGQSSYVINTGIYYQNDPLGLQISALYNVFGPRIVFVGFRNGENRYPDIVEMPRNTIDLTITKKISKRFSVNAGVSDLLNQQFIWLQDFNSNGKYERNTDERLLSYRRGSYYTVGLRFSY